MEKESEKQFGTGKAKVGLAVCAVLVVILSMLSVWLFIRVDSLQDQVDYLQREVHETRFSFYYVKPEEQKFGVYDLDDELQGLEWLHPYEEDVFDCGEMSAYLEWYLENEGWNTIIILGDAPFASGGHAWLLVETSTNHYTPVETTIIEIVWQNDPYFDNYFEYDKRFETIQEAIAYNESEFDWWE